MEALPTYPLILSQLSLLPDQPEYDFLSLAPSWFSDSPEQVRQGKSSSTVHVGSP